VPTLRAELFGSLSAVHGEALLRYVLMLSHNQSSARRSVAARMNEDLEYPPLIPDRPARGPR